MIVVLDFDGTITVRDTIGDIAAYGLTFQKQRGQNLATAWNHILQSYLEESGTYASGFEPPEDKRLTIAQEQAFLRGRRWVEAASLRRVEEAGIFKGLDNDRLFRAGQDALKNGTVQLRAGFKDFVDMLGRNNATIFIVSVSWSASFIQGVIDEPGIAVVANEISLDGRIIGPALLAKEGSGQANTVLTTSKDKVDAVQNMLAKPSTSTSTSRQLYFGDSTTDLECLLAVGGIVISDNEQSSLLRTLRRIGHDVPHVADGKAKICWARSFQEVLDNDFMSQ